MAEAMGKVLVTGGLGYLGRRLADHLRQNGLHVVQLTRRAPDTGEDEGVVTFGGDWEKEGADVFAGVDQVVHLACPDERQAAADPVGTTCTAFAFTHGMLQQAVRAGVRHVVLASTIHVYGRAMNGRVTEETLPVPVHPYGIIKRLMEDQVTAAASNRLGATILRLSNGFGAPLRPEMTRWTLLINDLCRQAVENGRLELRSDPRLLRNFITLEDICGVILHCLWHPVPAEVVTLNAGSSRSHSLGEMAELVQQRCTKVFGAFPELHVQALQNHPIPSLDYDTGRMRSRGIVLQENFAGEIDRELLACERWFGVSGRKSTPVSFNAPNQS